MISKIQIHEHGYVQYVDHMGTDLAIVNAARVSYDGTSKGQEHDKKLMRYLLKHKHTSPFEMGKISFEVKLPIFVMRQWVRHRMQNLNEVSARYTELPEEYYLPTVWRAQDHQNRQGSVHSNEGVDWHQTNTTLLEIGYHDAHARYKTLLERGVAREMARMVLPVGIYTKIHSCWDLNNLLKFFALRDDSHAQSEIQDYARAMKLITAELFPWTMEIYEEMRIK